ncbi:hypothetical protein GCK72_021001 [Caenorhabditis remanei]|uniref:G-protein coupled receptors family 1 profile domain-containing protein n=1 Tax=Caenorhabditis remanei TaxID=31234 RepID=A0A6A5GJ76_CAERE|nr:hypothetical protein GCK72_021001 [Caenorhabditis remanei]KAF1754439.1 hypothetical protein GCK72_021001 [Caenorhabditis remanei]
MSVVDAEEIFARTFDYIARLINVPISVFGIITNIFHFRILAQKSMRSSPVFTIMMVICMSDIIQLVSQMGNDIKYIVQYNHPDYCPTVDTYYVTFFTIVYYFLNGFSLFVSSWMAVLMAFFRSLSIKFAMSSFSETFSKKSTAHRIAITVTLIAFFYNLLCCLLKYSITPPTIVPTCPGEGPYYIIGGTKTNSHARIIFTFFDGITELFQLIFFTYSTVFLSRFIREASRKKVMKNVEERKTEKTEALILFTLLPFFAFMFPTIMANFSYPILVNFNRVPTVVTMSAKILTMLQTINASSHSIVCILMSSQYRDAAKVKCGPKRMRSTSVSG